MDTVLVSAALAIFLCALAALLTRRIKLKTYNGAIAISNGMNTISDILDGARGAAMFSAGCTAICAYLWWRGGGATVLAGVFAPCAASSPGCAVLPRNPQPDPHTSLLTFS